MSPSRWLLGMAVGHILFLLSMAPGAASAVCPPLGFQKDLEGLPRLLPPEHVPSVSSEVVLMEGDLARHLALAKAPGGMKRLRQAASRALRLPLPERAWVLRELALDLRPVAPELSFHLLDASETACRSLPRGPLRDGAFRGLALAFSETGDLKGVLRCLGAMEASHVRAVVGSECAARIAGLWEKGAFRLLERAQQDMAEVMDPALRSAVAARMAQIWARWDPKGAASLFSLAAETAEGIPDETGRGAAMAGVVQRSARHRWGWARSLARRISDPLWRVRALIYLVQFMPPHVPQPQGRALIHEILREVQGVDLPEERRILAFRLTAGVLSREPLFALEFIWKAKDPELRDEALLLWIRRWKEAKRALCTTLIQEIQGPSLRCEASREVLSFWAASDVEEILESLRGIEVRLQTVQGPLGRFRILLELAKTWREFSRSQGEAFLQRALKEALQIPSADFRAAAVEKIAALRGKWSLGPLEGRASRILFLSSVVRDEAEQCVGLALSHPEAALRMALRILDPYPLLRAKVLLSLAEVFIQSGRGPWKEALNAVRDSLIGIPPSLDRERVRGRMARIWARADDVQGVLVARSLKDGSIRERTLQEIARIRFEESPEGAFRLAASLKDLQRRGRLLRTLVAPWCSNPFRAQYRVDLLNDPKARYWAQAALVLHLAVRGGKGWRRPLSRLRTMMAHHGAKDRAEALALLIEALASTQSPLARRLLKEIPEAFAAERAYALMSLGLEGMRNGSEGAEADLRAALGAGLRMKAGWIRVRMLRRIGLLLGRLRWGVEWANAAYGTALQDAVDEGSREDLRELVQEWARANPWGAWRGALEKVDPLRFPSVVLGAARRLRGADRGLFNKAVGWAGLTELQELTDRLKEAWAPASDKEAWEEVQEIRQEIRRLKILGSWAPSLLRRSPTEGFSLLDRIRLEVERMAPSVVKAEICRTMVELLLPLEPERAVQWGLMGWEALTGAR